jgi:hypothetical protein
LGKPEASGAGAETVRSHSSSGVAVPGGVPVHEAKLAAYFWTVSLGSVGILAVMSADLDVDVLVSDRC